MSDTPIHNPESPRVSILLVDDRPENLLALESSLEGLGYDLVKARSGREALRSLLARDFAVILLDVQMPEMDGFETASLIRKRTRSGDTPIIFMTAVRKADIEVYEGYSAGAVDYMFKPFSPEILRAKVAVFVELFKAKANLEQQILEASRLNQELARSNKELESFAYVVSHDLNEPLRAVRNYLDLLTRRCSGKLDAEAEKFIAGAFRGAENMQRLIKDLLAFSRLSSKARPFEQVNLGAILDGVVEILNPAIRETAAAVTLGDLPAVMADPVQMTQLFQNLIGNAVKFRGEPTPTVHIFAAPAEQVKVSVLRDSRRSGWLIGVKDNGIGISRDHFDRIFMIFQRLHTRREYPGTGIGLAVCRKIVDRHGGTIWVDSKPGEGSTFYFTLPGVEPKDA
ncbi:MAG: ATP-binding protein [Thermodesulfobacteriota bacterium]